MKGIRLSLITLGAVALMALCNNHKAGNDKTTSSRVNMKRILIAIVAICLLSDMCVYAKQSAMDYKQPTNWLKYENTPIKEVDLFYILPTVIFKGTSDGRSEADSVAFFSDKEKVSAMGTFQAQAGTLESFTNVYAPFYRQVPLMTATTLTDSEDMVRLVRSKMGKQDIFAALDYYFKNANNGRPYILASHSQGTAIMRTVLDEYMKDHPEYYSRMVACYALGFSLPKSWLAANPHIKPATDETDTGVLIGWNTEAPGATLPSMLVSSKYDDYVINPLNWSTSAELVPASKNCGTVFFTMPSEEADGKTRTFNLVTPGVADAKIDANRGVLVCTTLDDNVITFEKFGGKSLHGMDWGGFYINIRENAIKRAEKFLGHSLNVNCMIEPGYAALPAPSPAPYKAKKVIDMEHHMFNAELIDYLKTRTDFPYYEDASGILYHEGSLLPIGVNIITPYKVSEASTGKPMVSILKNLDDIRLADMEVAGVTTAVISSGEAPEFLPREEAVKYAKATNDQVAAAMKAHPGKFLGSITLPTPYVEESVKELERAVKELGLKYWHTHSNYGHSYLYEKKYEPILAKCAELGIPFYIHPSYPTCDYLTNYGTMLSAAGFGFGVDVMKTAICIILNGTFDKYPDLKMILGHAGEFMPFCLDRMDNRFAIAEETGMPDPYVNNKRTFTDLVNDGNILVTTSGIFDPLVVEFLIKKIGADHIMLGTDYPYEDFKASVDFIKNLPVSNEDKDKILYKNAEMYILK